MLNKFEKRKSLIVGGVLLIAFGALIVTSLRSPIAKDPFWHLQMGIDWFENGLSPWVDHYSFTFLGNSITNPPVFFQSLLYLVVSVFGLDTGFQIFRFACFILTLGATILFLRNLKASAAIYAIVVPMIVALLQLRALVRPELLSYTFSIIALMLYFRAKNKISARNLIPVVALMFIWSNYHSSIIGYVIFVGFFLDCAVSQWESKATKGVWLKWFLWGVLVVAVGFLNPSFTHPLIQAITFPAEWKSIIQEYLPPAPFLKSIAGIYVLILIAIMTPILAFRQRRFGLLVVWAVLSYSAISMQRMVTPSGIVVVLIAAYLLVNSKIYSELKRGSSGVRENLVGFVLLMLVSAVLYTNVERARHFMDENRGLIHRYPVALVNYISDQNMSGNILNHYNIGGYLIYKLAPNNKVYIDGRTGILYPLRHMKKYNELRTTSSSEVLRAELDKYSINHIVWDYSQAKHDVVQDMGGFGLDFMNVNYVLYTRGESNFPLLGTLLSRPECWNSDMVDGLNAERWKMDDILPSYSSLFPFANFVVGYSNATDGKAFFDEAIEGDEWLDEMRRFAGFRFLQTGNYELVSPLLGGVKRRKPKDYLAPSFAEIKMGDHKLAAQILEEFANVKWPRLLPEEIFINYKLYQLLENNGSLTANERKRMDALKLQLDSNGHPNLESEEIFDAESFCVLPETQSE